MSASPSISPELLARVRVHMAQGRAFQASITSLDATDRLILATDAPGQSALVHPRAEQAINRIAPDWRRGEEPRRRKSAAISSGYWPWRAARRHRCASSSSGGSGELEMMVVAHYREDEVLDSPQRTQSRRRSGAAAAPRCRSPNREAQVLLWVSYGKSNRVISDVLQISPRTVTEHLGTDLRQDRRRDPLSGGGCRHSRNRPVRPRFCRTGGRSPGRCSTPLAGDRVPRLRCFRPVGSSGDPRSARWSRRPSAAPFFLAAMRLDLDQIIRADERGDLEGRARDGVRDFPPYRRTA